MLVCRLRCRCRHPSAASHPPRTTESDAANKQHGRAAVRRQWGPAANRPMVQERTDAGAQRNTIHTTRFRHFAN